MSGGLKDNPALAFGVLTGILRVSKENLFSGLNNPIVNSVLDEKYSQYFGFTEDEVTEMAEYYGKLDKLDELREWYDGYRFGDTEIYNPWSVANYFYNNCQARPYWTNTSDNEIIHEIMCSLTHDIAENLFSLMQGKTVQASLNMDVIYPGIIMEFKAVKKENSLPEAAKTALRQIDSKHYDTDLKDRGIRDIAKYGIAFAGKKVEIAT